MERKVNAVIYVDDDQAIERGQGTLDFLQHASYEMPGCRITYATIDDDDDRDVKALKAETFDELLNQAFNQFSSIGDIRDAIRWLKGQGWSRNNIEDLGFERIDIDYVWEED